MQLRMLRAAIASAFTKESGLKELFEDLISIANGDETSPEKARAKANLQRHIAASNRSLNAPGRK